MKRRNLSLNIILSIAMLALLLPDLWAQNYGQIRALKDRADTVNSQKNNFVVRVLRSYKIPCQITDEGIVARLYIQNRWYDVNQIEIVPLTKEIEGGYQVIAHEIFFYTESDILHLVSAATIR